MQLISTQIKLQIQDDSLKERGELTVALEWHNNNRDKKVCNNEENRNHSLTVGWIKVELHKQIINCQFNWNLFKDENLCKYSFKL